MDNSPFWKYLKLSLLLVVAILLIFIFSVPDKNFHIITCDVGQGDATLIIWRNNQILIDGGPDSSVLDCLGRHIPFYDKELELVILTHPDADHSFGLIEVVRRYKVDLLLKNNISSDTQGYRLLEKEVGSRGIKTIEPFAGQKMRVGLMQLDILWPDGESFSQTNAYSIVTEFKFGSFKALLTGDLQDRMKDKLIALGSLESVDYIKTSHHGSRNGVTNYLLDILRPKVAVISAGKKNRYGHPHKETLDLLKKYGIKVFRTDEMGDVEIISNGSTYWIK